MKKINQTLSELVFGILISGIVIWLVAVLFTGFDAVFAGSFGAGVLTAVFLAVHMYRSIDRALEMLPEDAEKYMRKAYLIRTVSIFVVAGIVCRINPARILGVFLGILCLKFGAFLQPLLHKFTGKDDKQE